MRRVLFKRQQPAAKVEICSVTRKCAGIHMKGHELFQDLASAFAEHIVLNVNWPAASYRDLVNSEVKSNGILVSSLQLK